MDALGLARILAGDLDLIRASDLIGWIVDLLSIIFGTSYIVDSNFTGGNYSNTSRYNGHSLHKADI